MATPGDFTCAELLEVTARAEEMWADNTIRKDLIAHVGTAQAILNEQTAQLEPLQDSDKDNEVKLRWIEMCDLTVEDCDTSCDLPVGDEPGAECKTYEITNCKEVRFSVSDEQFRDNYFGLQESTALGMAKAMKALDEHISQSIITAVDGFSGVNEYTGGIGTVAGTNTTIPAALWTPDAFAYFNHAAIINQMTNPFMLSGSNLFDESWIQAQNAARPESAGNMSKLDSIRKYFDLFYLDALVGKKTYVIDQGAVATVSKVRYSNVPTANGRGGKIYRWSVPSPNLPNVSYDVYYEAKCVTRDNTTHAYVMVARWDTFQNPVNQCNPTNTGVLSFECA